MHSVQSQISIPITLGDTARVLYISLSDGGLPYIIDDGCLAKLEIKRPTGTHLEEFCPVEKNTTIKYEFSQNENTAAVEGIHECAVVLYDVEANKICTPKFTLVVSDRVLSSDDLILTDEDKRIVETIVAAEIPRQEAEKERIEAENARQAAETARTEAEQIRQSGFDNYIERCQIPPITDSDNGKFMRVVDGKWKLAHSDAGSAYTYGNTDLTAGTSTLETGKLHVVYE